VLGSIKLVPTPLARYPKLRYTGKVMAYEPVLAAPPTETIYLSDRDSEIFLAALEAPPMSEDELDRYRTAHLACQS